MSPKERKNTQKIAVFFTPEHYEEIKKVAEDKGTTASALIRMITLEYLKK